MVRRWRLVCRLTPDTSPGLLHGRESTRGCWRRRQLSCRGQRCSAPALRPQRAQRLVAVALLQARLLRCRRGRRPSARVLRDPLRLVAVPAQAQPHGPGELMTAQAQVQACRCSPGLPAPSAAAGAARAALAGPALDALADQLDANYPRAAAGGYPHLHSNGCIQVSNPQAKKFCALLAQLIDLRESGMYCCIISDLIEARLDHRCSPWRARGRCAGGRVRAALAKPYLDQSQAPRLTPGRHAGDVRAERTGCQPGCRLCRLA